MSDEAALRQRIAELETALEGREELLRAITESAPDLIFCKDLELRYTLVNRALARAMGLPADDVLGRTAEDFVDQEAAKAMRAADLRTLRGETVEGERTVDLGGRARALHVFQVPLHDREGRVTGVAGFARDVSERRRVEAQLLASQKLESLGVLAGGIAHDFNNLLMAVLGNASLALFDLPEEGEARRCVKDIEEAAHHAASLCRQMLAYSGQGRFVIEPIDLSRVVAEMARMLEVAISRKASFEMALDRRLARVEADRAQVAQLVMNLVTNASEALDGGVGTVAVRTGARRFEREELDAMHLGEDATEGLYAFLEVSDTGVGMAPDVASRIFDPFFTTKFTGRGLGLSAVLGIVRGHRGAIAVETSPGEGTTITAVMPAIDGGDPRATPLPEPESLLVGGSRVVLVVDDEPTVRKVAVHMLQRLGFATLTAGDGAEAAAVFRRHKDEVACVLLDLTMPAMDGAECFERLREARPGVRVILSSGFHEHELEKRFAGSGFAAFAQKPYTIEVLRSKLASVLDGG